MSYSKLSNVKLSNRRIDFEFLCMTCVEHVWENENQSFEWYGILVEHFTGLFHKCTEHIKFSFPQAQAQLEALCVLSHLVI